MGRLPVASGRVVSVGSLRSWGGCLVRAGPSPGWFGYLLSPPVGPDHLETRDPRTLRDRLLLSVPPIRFRGGGLAHRDALSLSGAVCSDRDFSPSAEIFSGTEVGK